MKLLEYMNSHPNWELELTESPYYISTKRDGDYYLLKYNLIFSDFTNDLVKQSRGTIVRQNENGEWICVRNAFSAFRNYGEAVADTNKIDWSLGVSVQEKVDGSLISLYFDCGEWRIATSGTISAFGADCGDTNFGELFFNVLGKNNKINFLASLDIDYCYTFELVSPTHNHIVVRYNEDAIYFLGARNMKTMEEVHPDIFDFSKFGIRKPKLYTYNSLAECIDKAHSMSNNEEGYVVCAYNQMIDGSFLRIKIKGDEYLRLHKLRGNGALTTLKVIDLWQLDTLDDFSAYYPEYQTFIDATMSAVKGLIQYTNSLWIDRYDMVNADARKDFALSIKNEPSIIQGCLFSMYKVKDNAPLRMNSQDYYKSMRSRNLASYIMTKVEQKEIGVVEDE